MSKYDVYGIGNALVDMEFEVDVDFLNKMKIEKGLMTLVDGKRQKELLAGLKQAPRARCCGGSAANTIIAVVQWGGKAFYSCKVAADETGDFFYHDLVSRKVRSNLEHMKRPGGDTGKCMVFITPDADRTMNTYLGITETFSVSELMEHELAKARYLYIEGYLVTSPTGKQAALTASELAGQYGVKRALTFSDPALVGYFREAFDQIIGDKIDLLFCNEQEAMQYTSSQSIELAAERLKEKAHTFAITLGPQGAIVFDGNELHQIPTKSVVAVDTNGAGDLFAGTFLYAINHGFNFKQAGIAACQASSVLVGQFGTKLQQSQIEQLKEEFFHE